MPTLIHYTHVLIALIWAIAILGLNAIEFYFLFLSGTVFSYLIIFGIAGQNVIIAAANSYYLSKFTGQVSATGASISQTTSQAKP